MTEVLLHNESFTYMLHSSERLNGTITSPIFYKMLFGGFSQNYDDYHCEVISFATLFVSSATTSVLAFTSENLIDNGYFIKNQLTRKDGIISFLPLDDLSNTQTQSDQGISFKVRNCRVPKEVTFYWLTPTLTPLNLGGNNINASTRWLLTLKMTPIIKKSLVLYKSVTEVFEKDESFIYMLYSNERKNALAPAGQLQLYEFDFGGFSEYYEDYKCEVISFAAVSALSQVNGSLLFVSDGLVDDGYCIQSIFNRKEAVLSIIPRNALNDNYINSDGANAFSFRVNNCRVPKPVTFYFLNSDLTGVTSGSEININNSETRWFLTLKMTPIKKVSHTMNGIVY
jgi:hypothetical protein